MQDGIANSLFPALAMASVQDGCVDMKRYAIYYPVWKKGETTDNSEIDLDRDRYCSNQISDWK